MSKAVFCIAKTESLAQQIVTKLKAEGFRRDDISVLFPDKTGSSGEASADVAAPADRGVEQSLPH